VRTLLLWLVCCASLGAQGLSIVVHDPTGQNPDTPLSSTYTFPGTPANSASSVVLRISNPSSTAVEVMTVTLSNGADFTTVNPNFTITGLFVNKVLTPNSANFEEFTVNFTPGSTGLASGILRASYLTQQSGCTFGSSSSPCPSGTVDFATLQGTGLTPTLVVSYAGNNGSSAVLQPNSTVPLDFGSISTNATSTIAFTISNQTSSSVSAPSVALQSGVFLSSAFSLAASALPPAIPAYSSASFTVTFAPGQTGFATATLTIGQNSYGLSGTGIVVADTDALQISYSDSGGVRTLPQAATPINFGQIASGSAVLTFYVMNPAVSFNAITVPSVTATGAGFALASLPTLPAAIQPGQSISFQLVFTPAGTGTYNGTLTIGTRQFSITAKGSSSSIPDASFQVDQSPLSSQQQAHLSIQLAAAAPVNLIGTLTMQFTPSVSGVSDDPAINFLATSGRQLQVTAASGSQTTMYNGQSALTFQTGTTAGTLTFTLTFPNKAPMTKSFMIAPTTVQITSAQALRQDPNLVLNLTGYDNTYSIGSLNFQFYDTNGKTVVPNGITVDAASSFKQFFFNNNQAGGAFTMQASFPVRGDVTKIASVVATFTNSAGTATSKSTFQ